MRVVSMRNDFGRKILKFLLSALVLAWGTVSPAIQHAHVEGNDPTHRHADRHELTHHPAHHHDSDGEHYQRLTVADLSPLTDFVVHLHLRWLGIECSLPVPEEPVQGNDEDTPPPAIVHSVEQTVPATVPATRAGPSLARVLLAVIRAPHVDVVPDLTPVPRPRSATSIPLCDSARLERSGVLLA